MGEGNEVRERCTGDRGIRWWRVGGWWGMTMCETGNNVLGFNLGFHLVGKISILFSRPTTRALSGSGGGERGGLRIFFRLPGHGTDRTLAGVLPPKFARYLGVANNFELKFSL